jgi:hypothetical protein
MTMTALRIRMGALALACFTFASLAYATGPAQGPHAITRPLDTTASHARSLSSWRGKAPGTRAIAAAAKAHEAPRPALHGRDWRKSPPIVELEPKGELYAISDPHGRYDEVVQLLRAQGLVAEGPKGLTWAGGPATLVVVGDIINKGPGSIALLDLLRSLQNNAGFSGGRVVVTMGNHEAEFLDAPFSERAQRNGEGGRFGVSADLKARGIDPADVAAARDAEGRGAWMRDLPLAAKIGKYFFVHGGDTGGRYREQLAYALRTTIDTHGFGHNDIVGVHTGVLGTGNWQRTAQMAAMNASRVGAQYIVMGHIPHALDAHGDIARSRNGALLKIDTGLGNGDGPARILHINAYGEIRQRDDSGRAFKVRMAR